MRFSLLFCDTTDRLEGSCRATISRRISMKLFRSYLNCSSADKRLLLQALMLVGLVRFGLWALPFRVVVRHVAGLAHRSWRAERGDRSTARRIAWAVRAACRLVPSATCLPQALATQVLLARWGIQGHLRIGVAKDIDGRLAAHAWIESDGSVLIGNLPGLSRFAELPSLAISA